jgi:hypothetical protein
VGGNWCGLTLPLVAVRRNVGLQRLTIETLLKTCRRITENAHKQTSPTGE